MAEGMRGRLPSTLRSALATAELRRCQGAAATWRVVELATLVAVSVHLFSAHGAGAVAAFGTARALAPAVGVPLVTAAASRFGAGALLVAGAGVAAVGSAATAVAIGVDLPLALVLAASALTCVGLYSVRPLVSSLYPRLVRTPEQLVASNALGGLLDGSGSLIGPVVGGAAAATIGATGLLSAAAVVLVGLAATLLPLRRVAAPADSDMPRRGRVVDGFAAVSSSRAVGVVVALGMAQTTARGALNVLVVVFAIEVLDLGAAGPGLLLGAVGVGGVIAFPVALRIAEPGRLARALAVAIVLWGLPIALAANAPAGAALVLFTVIGLGNDVVDITLFSLLQRLVPEHRLTGLLGALETVLYVGMATGAAAAAWAARDLGVRPALVATGLALSAAGAAAWFASVATDRQLARRDGDVVLLQLQALFSPLTMSVVDRLASAVEHVEVDAGAVLLRKGEVGDRYLIIEDGLVEVRDDHRVVATLGPGDGLGEIALVRDVPRTATAVAVTPVRARALAAGEFRRAIGDDPEAVASAEALVESRLEELRRSRSVAPSG